VLVASVEVGFVMKCVNPWIRYFRMPENRTFYPQSTDLIKVVAIYMRIYTEQATDYGSNGVTKVLRKRCA
jgi:hypothetical protein